MPIAEGEKNATWLLLWTAAVAAVAQNEAAREIWQICHLCTLPKPQSASTWQPLTTARLSGWGK